MGTTSSYKTKIIDSNKDHYSTSFVNKIIKEEKTKTTFYPLVKSWMLLKKNNDKTISKNKSIRQNKKTRWWKNANVQRKLELDFTAKLGGDLSWCTQHLKSNWVKTSLVSHNTWSQIGWGMDPFCFTQGWKSNLILVSLRHKNQVNIKIKASYEQRIFVHETILKQQTTIKCQPPFNSWLKNEDDTVF
jgi:hypothetical protein